MQSRDILVAIASDVSNFALLDPEVAGGVSVGCCWRLWWSVIVVVGDPQPLGQVRCKSFDPRTSSRCGLSQPRDEARRDVIEVWESLSGEVVVQ